MIGFFDSGFGGLTVLKHVVKRLPRYNYLYLGDNARVPYGSRSEWLIYEFTRQAVDYLFKEGCYLIIIACNTASANALRKIQQEYLPKNFPHRRVLGVIRPSAEEVAECTSVHKVGILATEGVVAARSYIIEIQNQNPEIQVFQQACPLLVPLIEAGEQDWIGTEMIVKRYLEELFAKDSEIDTILLACTHYPILCDLFRKHTPSRVVILEQGPIVAKKLENYLFRHPEIECNLRKKGVRVFLSTDKTEKFDRLAKIFFGAPVFSKLVTLESLCTI